MLVVFVFPGTLTSIPENITCGKSDLTEVRVSKTDVTNSAPLGCCETLRELRITHHEISETNISRDCDALTLLKLRHGVLTVFPDLSGNQELVTVDVSRNRLTTLTSEQLPSSGKLRSLNLEKNRFVALPEIQTFINTFYVLVSS